jgi:protease IV
MASILPSLGRVAKVNAMAYKRDMTLYQYSLVYKPSRDAGLRAEPRDFARGLSRRRQRIFGFVGAICGLTFVLVSFQGHAEKPQLPLAGEPPTAGIHLAAPSLVGGEDATGIELNSANLGLLESWSLVYHHSWFKSDGRINGAGDAFFLATPLPFFRSLALGFGLQFLRPAAAIGYDASSKVSFALAWRFSSAFSFGLSHHLFISDQNEAQDRLSTTDLGLVVRPAEWVAGALTVRDLTTPVFDGMPLQRVYDVELALRPLATRQWEFGLGLGIGERRGNLDPHLRLEMEPLSGVRFYGALDLLTRDFSRTGAWQTDVRASLGFGFNLEQIGLTIGTTVARDLQAGPGPLQNNETRSSFQGLEGSLKLWGAKQAPLVTAQHLLVNLELSGDMEQSDLLQLVQLVWELEERPEVTGVLMHLDGLNLGWAQAQELRGLIQRLRQRGKKVYVYLRAASDREYYVSLAANRILLDPAGEIRLQGLSMRSVFFRGAFDLLGVAPQFVRIAEFKSAPESYTEHSSSPAARQMMQSLLEDSYQRLMADLAQGRHKTEAAVQQLIDQGPFIPPAALRAGLVDELVEVVDLPEAIEKLSEARLIKPTALIRAATRWPVGPAIAVVLVEGDIVRGKSSRIPLLDRQVAGDETLAKTLSWVRNSDTIKAVVLRVNSPGGSAMASDHIWREIDRTRRVKPVIVSMGNIAASGGYYVAAAGDRIYALPSTITGSIGIFSGKFDLSGLMKKLGLSLETFSQGQHANLDSFDRPYTEEERRSILAHLQYYYRRFLGVVAAGRHLTQDQVHQVARGRVWTGHQAQARKLVDASGGLMEALEEAQRRTGLTDRPVRYIMLPRPEVSLLARALGLLTTTRDAAPPSLPAVLTRALQGFLPVLLRSQAGEPLARLPFHVDF